MSAPPIIPITNTEISKFTRYKSKARILRPNKINRNNDIKTEDKMPPRIPTITAYFKNAWCGSRFIKVKITPKIVPNANWISLERMYPPNWNPVANEIIIKDVKVIITDIVIPQLTFLSLIIEI